MQLIPVDESNRQQVLLFLARREAACASLTECVLQKGGSIFNITGAGGRTEGVISVRHTVLHCLPGAADKEQAERFAQVLSPFLADKKIACVNGEETGTQFLLQLLARSGLRPASMHHYRLMTQPRERIVNAAGILPKDWHVLRCREADADALMELQSGYEKEEVLPPCRTFMAAVVRQNLERILKNEYVLSLRTANGTFIAKANTNALGIHYAQIGGVYTEPPYRGRRFASLLVSTLVRNIYLQKKKPVLFVKDTNAPAIRLYESLGFVKSGTFVIAYF